MIDLPGGPSAHPALSRPGLVAGIGLRARADLAELLGLLDAGLAAVGADRANLLALATLDIRADHPALLALAQRLDLPVLPLAPDDLAAAVPNPSLRVAALADVPSVAEASALVFGPLLLEKQRSANCTCALSRYAPAGVPSAMSASSRLATSSAGP